MLSGCRTVALPLAALLLGITLCLHAASGDLVSGPTDKVFFTGASVQLPCTATAFGAISYLWSYNNSASPPTWLVQCGDLNSGDVCIVNPTPSHSGYFRCVAESNSQVLGNQSGLIQIIKAIHFSPTPQDKQVLLGHSAILSCGIDTQLGSAATLSWWFREASSAVVEVQTSITVTIKTNNDLVFGNIQDVHLGQYFCVASNAAGRVNVSAWLRTANSRKPTVQGSGPSVQVASGGVLVLDCKISGTPSTVSVTWYKESQLFQEVIPHRQILTNHSLRITDFRAIDQGSYKCSAMNTFGTTESSTSDVTLATTTGDSGSSSSSTNLIIGLCAGGAGGIMLIALAIFLLRKPGKKDSGIRATNVRVLETDMPAQSFGGRTGSVKVGFNRKSQRSSLEQRMSRTFSDTTELIRDLPEGDAGDITEALG